MKIFIGADHRGFELKEKLKNFLQAEGHEVEDLGALSYEEGDDFVEYAINVARQTVNERGGRGILLCGSGAGVEIAANKIGGARCTLGYSQEQIAKARDADNVNILALASEFIDLEKAKVFVKSFLDTPYDPAERHERRIKKIEEIKD